MKVPCISSTVHTRNNRKGENFSKVKRAKQLAKRREKQGRRKLLSKFRLYMQVIAGGVVGIIVKILRRRGLLEVKHLDGHVAKFSPTAVQISPFSDSHYRFA